MTAVHMASSSQPQSVHKSRLLADFDKAELDRLVRGDHCEPHRILGVHPAPRGGPAGVVVRALHPDATRVECVLRGGETVALDAVHRGGLFAALLAERTLPLAYHLRFGFSDGRTWEIEDPYRFLPTFGEVDLHLFAEGTHRRLWEQLGANRRCIDGVDGVSFAVWAPNARRVSVVGDFCRWDGRLLPMRQLGVSGVFELFVPGVAEGALYKYELKTAEGALRVKTDPLARAMECPPATASRVVVSRYEWGDDVWMAQRPQRDPRREPMLVYEVHQGSWCHVVEEDNRPLTYREIAGPLIKHMQRFGFTHLELLPVCEHPFSGSWGYQVSGYYAPTARYGSPDDLRYLIDMCHRSGIAVILDWVPAHFPKDDFALRRFDGTALYEHADPRLGEHPDWGTLIFNYGRGEVRSFLVANALYWLQEFHVDGLRVDAVASMLYRDYSRRSGEWLPNEHGGRENLEAIGFLRDVNDAVRGDCPGCIMVAEESTAWPGVTRPTREGGLGFTFKWNMGWMHDTLSYFARDPIHRRYHHDQITFAMLYEYTEHFIMPLSHDEVVHGKRSLLEKMPGDLWRKFANLRLLLGYQYARPGKKLIFMGTELAPHQEWRYDASLDWHLQGDPMRQRLALYLEDLGRLYRSRPCLWRSDSDPSNFFWIDCADRDNSVLSFWRRDANDALLVVLNCTPVPRPGYRVGVPLAGRYTELLSSDDPRYGGSEFKTQREVCTEQVPMHNHPQSLSLNLPPLGILIVGPAG